MKMEHVDTPNAQSVLERLTRTLLYEGYALYPYHRSAIKNQKPIPFGVVYPQGYHAYNEHAPGYMQTQCIVTGCSDLRINITVRFLHLKKIEIIEKKDNHEKADEAFLPVPDASYHRQFYQSGWQTVERQISTGAVSVAQLIQTKKCIEFDFDKIAEEKNIDDATGKREAKQIATIAPIKGVVTVKAAAVENSDQAFCITVGVANTTPVENAETLTRDEICSQSFLSTHIILQTTNGKFVSHHNPEEKWVPAITACKNMHTWPIVIDEDHTTLLSSPIILYDYPQIHPQSSGDLFDSTEIEEALLLHVALLSDEEKSRMAQSDDKLQAMLNKVSQLTPEELLRYHSNLLDSTQPPINNEQKSEL